MSIKANAEIIRDETTPGANTASRVGGNLVEIADDLLSKQTEINANTAKVSFDLTSSTRLANTNGTNTGDQNLSGFAPINSPAFTGTVSGITKAMVGLGNVDNTTDANKPVSTLQQTALDAKTTGSGTANRLPKFTATGVVGDSQIFDNGTNIGIGNNNPQRKIDISLSGFNNIKLGEWAVGTGPIPIGVTGVGGAISIARPSDGADGILGFFVHNDKDLGVRARGATRFYQVNTQVFAVLENGNLLINKITDNGDDKLQVNGSVSVTTLKTSGFTVATLPAPPAQGLGAIAHVTDALNPTYLGTITGGGTVKCPVFYNGTNWVSS